MKYEYYLSRMHLLLSSPSNIINRIIVGKRGEEKAKVISYLSPAIY